MWVPQSGSRVICHFLTAAWSLTVSEPCGQYLTLSAVSCDCNWWIAKAQAAFCFLFSTVRRWQLTSLACAQRGVALTPQPLNKSACHTKLSWRHWICWRRTKRSSDGTAGLRYMVPGTRPEREHFSDLFVAKHWTMGSCSLQSTKASALDAIECSQRLLKGTSRW